MNPEITQEQNKLLVSWADQRDKILLDISHLRIDQQTLVDTNKDLGISNKEIADKIQQSVGRLEELSKKEKEYVHVVSDYIVTLEKDKTRLETENSSLLKENTSLLSIKENLTKDISFLRETHDSVFNRSILLEKIVEHVTRVNYSNVKELEDSVNLLKQKIEEILKLSTVNIEAHNQVLSEIPKLFVELKRKSIEREIIIKHKNHE